MIIAGDETSISQTPTVVRTWSRVGKTPLLAHPFSWKRVSALVLMSSEGHLSRDTMPGSFTGARVLLNLKALLGALPGRQIVVLVDGASIHWTNRIKQWLAQPDVAARLTLEPLPPYAPDMNPVELLNSASKRRGMGNFFAEDLASLCERFRQAFTATPETIRAYFKSALGTDFRQKCQEAA